LLVDIYQWDFGDGTKSTEPLVQHIYKTAGKYNVILKVVDDKGETDTMSVPVAVSWFFRYHFNFG